jgi:alkanesulfonate monooxygenase SsuD/methylene tetrahydromethanopterin reductase-like flavin-dependent oxidoreductase (luciferase family)
VRTAVSIGITNLTEQAAVVALAPRIERLGFHALWVNDLAGADSLERLRGAAGVTESLHLATGVIPLDRRPAASLELDGLPVARTTIGIGSGRAAKPLGLVRDGIRSLRERTEASVVVGALGPRMRELAATRADGALLNWLTPGAATDATAELHRDAEHAEGGARPGRSVLYARTIVDASARPALEREAASYEGFPAYAANFERLGFAAMDATVADASALAAYEGTVDELVLRAITPSNSLAELERFVERTAEWVAAGAT